jgi:hypothetical protein
MKKMNKELNEIIEMIKKDCRYYEECKSIAIAYGSSDELMAYYSTILAYIDSVITRIKEEIEQ